MPTTTYVCMPQRRCLGASYKAQNRVTQSTPGTRYYVVLMCSFWVSPESLCWDFGAPFCREGWPPAHSSEPLWGPLARHATGCQKPHLAQDNRADLLIPVLTRITLLGLRHTKTKLPIRIESCPKRFFKGVWPQRSVSQTAEHNASAVS